MERTSDQNFVSHADETPENVVAKRIESIRALLRTRDEHEGKLLWLLSRPDTLASEISNLQFQLKRHQADIDRLISDDLRERL